MPKHTLSFTRLAGSLALLIACGLGAWAAFAQAPARTVRDGVFSAAQVERGRHQFTSICMNCHEIAEFTGPGAYFEESDGKTVWEIFEFIWAEMPEDEPASLDPKDYAAILAYTLSVYGLPTGEADLPIDRESLDAIEIVRPERPGS
jgi:mono/diheme cytochrome c family protein